MFKKTQIRLVTLNVIVFVLLFTALGATLYFFMKVHLYTQADRELMQIVSRTTREDQWRLLFTTKKRERGVDRRIVFLFWDQYGMVLKKSYGETLDSEDLDEFRPQIGKQGLETLTVNGHTYRVLTLPTRIMVQAGPTMFKVNTIQLIYNLEPEGKMLKSLLFVICVGEGISVVIAIFVGLFLARRALVPIQLSWNKQQQFIADASHELRTPLSVILLNLERLFRHPGHTIEQESETISVSIQETKRLNKLVTDLLTLARSDSNELRIIAQRVRLDEIAYKSIQTFRQFAELKEIEIRTEIDAGLEIVGDKERLHQLFVILLDNALKYTPEHGSITVTCRRENNAFLISVADTGVGIPKEDVPHIFDRFYRSDKMRTRSSEGTGLGLSIAKWIVDAHGGKIQVESEPGVGTTFFVTLPVKAKSA